MPNLRFPVSSRQWQAEQRVAFLAKAGHKLEIFRALDICNQLDAGASPRLLMRLLQARRIPIKHTHAVAAMRRIACGGTVRQTQRSLWSVCTWPTYADYDSLTTSHHSSFSEAEHRFFDALAEYMKWKRKVPTYAVVRCTESSLGLIVQDSARHGLEFLITFDNPSFAIPETSPLNAKRFRKIAERARRFLEVRCAGWLDGVIATRESGVQPECLLVLERQGVLLARGQESKIGAALSALGSDQISEDGAVTLSVAKRNGDLIALSASHLETLRRRCVSSHRKMEIAPWTLAEARWREMIESSEEVGLNLDLIDRFAAERGISQIELAEAIPITHDEWRVMRTTHRTAAVVLNRIAAMVGVKESEIFESADKHFRRLTVTVENLESVASRFGWTRPGVQFSEDALSDPRLDIDWLLSPRRFDEYVGRDGIIVDHVRDLLERIRVAGYSVTYWAGLAYTPELPLGRQRLSKVMFLAVERGDLIQDVAMSSGVSPAIFDKGVEWPEKTSVGCDALIDRVIWGNIKGYQSTLTSIVADDLTVLLALLSCSAAIRTDQSQPIATYSLFGVLGWDRRRDAWRAREAIVRLSLHSLSASERGKGDPLSSPVISAFDHSADTEDAAAIWYVRWATELLTPFGPDVLVQEALAARLKIPENDGLQLWLHYMLLLFEVSCTLHVSDYSILCNRYVVWRLWEFAAELESAFAGLVRIGFLRKYAIVDGIVSFELAASFKRGAFAVPKLVMST
ncbi:hypothetical protein [Paraburkholderia sp. RL18-085-BIA-A]|uniref:hypothetical protein n=1 Tax=Paraburkholderia sp. RL18-085-BIA-A TaxID=3031633 RepID=UPI0038B8E77E